MTTSNTGLMVDLINNDRTIRFLLALPVILAVSFVLPEWSLLGTTIYGLALGYRS